MMRALAMAAVMLSAGSVQAARIDEGALPDLDRFIQGCWVNAEGTLTGQVEICFTEGIVGTALIDDAGVRLAAAPGSYSFRNEKIVLTNNTDWVFGRATLICDVGVKPYVRLGLFGCVGSGEGEPVVFFDDMLFLPSAAT